MGESFFFVLRDSLPLDESPRNPGSDHFAKLRIGETEATAPGHFGKQRISEMNVQNRGIYPQIRRGTLQNLHFVKENSETYPELPGEESGSSPIFPAPGVYDNGYNYHN
jgi:hypothetical protein